MANNYYEQLKDPRWQKKRLEIMEASGFTCCFCGDNTETLNVHHRIYKKNHKPWDYEEEDYFCLCETCHKEVHKDRDELNHLIYINFDVNNPTLIKRLIGYIKGISLAGCPMDHDCSNCDEAEGIADYWRVDAKDIMNVLSDRSCVICDDDIYKIRQKNITRTKEQKKKAKK